VKLGPAVAGSLPGRSNEAKGTFGVTGTEIDNQTQEKRPDFEPDAAGGYALTKSVLNWPGWGS
jgi:hypothetical protein